MSHGYMYTQSPLIKVIMCMRCIFISYSSDFFVFFFFLFRFLYPIFGCVTVETLGPLFERRETFIVFISIYNNSERVQRGVGRRSRICVSLFKTRDGGGGGGGGRRRQRKSKPLGKSPGVYSGRLTGTVVPRTNDFAVRIKTRRSARNTSL